MVSRQSHAVSNRRGQRSSGAKNVTPSRFGSLLDRRTRQLQRVIDNVRSQSQSLPFLPSTLSQHSPDDLPQTPRPTTSSISLSTVPLARRPLTSDRSQLPSRHILRPFSASCTFCNAICFWEERTPRSNMAHPLFSICCREGSVSLPSFPAPPEPLKSLLTDDDLSEQPLTVSSMLT